MRNTHCSTWIWQETLKILENDIQTLKDLENVDKTDKRLKSETHMVGPGIWRETLKNVQNEKQTL